MNVRTEGNAPLPLGATAAADYLRGPRRHQRNVRRTPSASDLAAFSKEKCEGATGSLAIVASGRGPSHPRSLHHGSRLPAMSRRGAASSMIS
jgi:hypothetical protein